MVWSRGRSPSRRRLASLAVACSIVFLLLYSISRRRLLPFRYAYAELPLRSDLLTSALPDAAGNRAMSSTATVTVTQTAFAASPSSSSLCDLLPAFDNLVVVVKTGATEAYDRLPTQLLTFLRCATKNLVIFSDMEQDVAGHHVYDALDEVAEEVVRDNPDFDLYQTQKRWRSTGEDIKRLARDRADDAWNLDKYKNIHTARKAWQRHPNKDWYIFIDADSYIVWPTIAKWIKRLNAKEALFLGSTAYVGNIPFAHGGSGYMISGTAMAKFAAETGSKRELSAFFDQRAKEACCGDLIIAESLFREKVKLHHVWPMINGEKPRSLPFGPTHWCQPIITMHHMGSEEITDMWNFELERAKPDVPLLLKDIFDHFLAPNLTEARDDWDNLSEDSYYQHPDVEVLDRQKSWKDCNDLEKQAHKSFDDCGRACKADEYCYQWSFISSTCAFSNSIRLGKGKPSSHSNENLDEQDRIRSGWDLEKIQKFRLSAGECPSPMWIDVGKANVYYWEDSDGI